MPPSEHRIIIPNEKDVLMSRGGQSNNHAGNVSYRKFCKEQKEVYRGTKDKNQKNALANTVFDKVIETGGRFLKKETDTYGSGYWTEIEDKDIVIQKIKQALRDKDAHEKRTFAQIEESEIDPDNFKRANYKNIAQQAEKRSKFVDLVNEQRNESLDKYYKSPKQGARIAQTFEDKEYLRKLGQKDVKVLS